MPSNSFFHGGCPEVRVARDECGKNRLSEFIHKNNLLSAGISEKRKGRIDKVVIEVIEPYKRFKSYIQ